MLYTGWFHLMTSMRRSTYVSRMERSRGEGEGENQEETPRKFLVVKIMVSYRFTLKPSDTTPLKCCFEVETINQMGVP